MVSDVSENRSAFLFNGKDSCTIARQLYHHETAVSSRDSCIITRQLYHHEAAVPSRGSCIITRQLYHHETAVPSQDSCIITRQLYHHKTAVPSQDSCIITRPLRGPSSLALRNPCEIRGFRCGSFRIFALLEVGLLMTFREAVSVTSLTVQKS